jgi:glycosyltransferase involved in cell wall biosynthesis
MRIALDLSVIQTPHRMRGIGATALNFVNNLSEDAKKEHQFIIFLYHEGQDEALQLLNLSGMEYRVELIAPAKTSSYRLPGRLRIINGLINNFRKLATIYRGDERFNGLTDIDAFLQFDQLGPLPSARKIKKARILYDVIPYVLGDDYLWSYSVARKYGDSRKSALRKHVHRVLYKVKTRAAAKQADVLISISEHTKRDFEKYMGIKPKNIDVVHLGINDKKSVSKNYPEFKEYAPNSWGYLPKPIDLREKPFLLFVGGADPRRKLNHLVAAFNNLRGEGNDIRLILAGDTMTGARSIPVLETQKYISHSSYIEDIVFLGFIDEAQKDWLYQHAVAFVYPSVYEGFGLPVLEAMRYGTPVITYDNSSISEIAGDAALFTKDFQGIAENVRKLIRYSDEDRSKTYSKLGIRQAQKFSWAQTSTSITNLLTKKK